ncbi:MAG: cobalt-precorrin 5A hydrolase [Oscillospiraceae bacterium]|nr:cobalt-precorrin 5A hydrolase [Oscillospiraceae bacterium]
MNISVLSVTERGRRLSERVAQALSGDTVHRFCYQTHTDVQAQTFTSITAQTADLFHQMDALVFVCASGIAVRAIAPHVQHKTIDPAVLVMDDAGQFVIPLLSGHLGGANALTVRLADALGAVPVVTTATDSGGVFSPDCYAVEQHLALTDLHVAKVIAAAVLDGERVGFVSDFPAFSTPDGLVSATDCRTGLCITEDMQKTPFPITLRLMPKNLAVGIGCKKGTPEEVITRRVETALTAAGFAPERICAVTTIDLKAHEPGLLVFCRKRRVPLVTYTAEELMRVRGDFTQSDFVRRMTGADNVCERSAVLYGGELVLRKTAGEGVTIACACLKEEVQGVKTKGE